MMEPRSRSSLAGVNPARACQEQTGLAPRPVGLPIPEADILVADARWHRLVPQVTRLVRRAARAGGGITTVVLDSDLRIKRLNARHRGRNKPTNVLTFENQAGFPGQSSGPDAGGEIVLALETVRREAHDAGRLPAHHLAHLVVHGALHLRGHDHHAAGDARRMEMQETRILHRLRVPNPWKSGSAGSFRP